MSGRISKKNLRILLNDGYVGIQIRPRGATTDIILNVTKPEVIIGEKGRRIRELSGLIRRKFDKLTDKFVLYVDPLRSRFLSAIAQADLIKEKLSCNTPVRKACYTTIRSAMSAGARGVEVIVSGKIRGQRAKSMKFSDGLMLHSGNPARDNVDFAIRSVLLKQGVLGIKVRINKPVPADGDIIKDPSCCNIPDKIVYKNVKSDYYTGEPKIDTHVQPTTVENIPRPPSQAQNCHEPATFEVRLGRPLPDTQ